MSTGVITSFTLIDFPSESEMTAFFVFLKITSKPSLTSYGQMA